MKLMALFEFSCELYDYFDVFIGYFIGYCYCTTS